MEEFLSYLRKGEFKLPICQSCNAKVWPPSSYCRNCLSRTSLHKIKKVGTLLEFTESYTREREGKFGIVDISGIRLVGLLNGSGVLHEGMKVKMVECGVRSDGSAFYNFQPVNVKA